MVRGTDSVYFVITQEIGVQMEAQDVSNKTRCFILCIPIASDLSRIFLIQHGIEERLFRQARRKTAESGGTDQIKFSPTDGTIECGELMGHIWKNRPALKRGWSSRLHGPE